MTPQAFQKTNAPDAMVRMSAKTSAKWFGPPSEDVVRELGRAAGLNKGEIAELLEKPLNTGREGKCRELSRDEKRDVLLLYWRLGEPPTPAHLEYISKQLDIKRVSVIAFLHAEVWYGDGCIGECSCGRKYPAVTREDTMCAVCELDHLGNGE